MKELAQALGEKLGASNVQENQALARHTSLRVGGPAELLAVVTSADELSTAASLAWARSVPCRVLGSGANVLIGDAGIDGLVILNRARAVRFGDRTVRAESGASFSTLGRQAVARGMSGLVWATGIPGTVGGAVVGNAGAWGGDVASALAEVSILTPSGLVESWSVECLEYGYRTSVLKRMSAAGEAAGIVLAAQFTLEEGNVEVLKAEVDDITRRRKASQPPGASCGSVFKNPPGDYAGRLVEAAGLKGHRIGGAHVSEVHANFIVNDGEATAWDVRALIEMIQEKVESMSGIRLELEIELLGGWTPARRNLAGGST